MTFGPLPVEHGETWSLLRRSPRDRVGDSSFTDAGEIDRCVFWWDQVSEDTDRRETSVTNGSLAVPKSAGELIPRAQDRVESPDGQQFGVVGRPAWTGKNPFDGWDPGYVVVRVKAVG